MTFLEILNCEKTNLPVQQRPESNFRMTIKNVLDTFGDLIDSSDNLTDSRFGEVISDSLFKEKNKILRDGIIKSIDAYYEGKPYFAYKILRDSLQESNVKSYLDKSSQLETNQNLFRIRIQNGSFPLTSEELFHIPFEKRGIVTTQRYSIPGLPSLYLANSIYVAWEELLRPSFGNIQAVRLINTKTLRLLDITTDIYNKNDVLIESLEQESLLLYKVMTWPLVAACSFKVFGRDDVFKPEYIIPQLLLQWINTNNLDGIQYSSTHIDPKKTSGLFYNLVIPVQTFNKDNGLCPVLSALFESTEVLPMQLRQFVSTSDRLAGQATISTDVNRDIDAIELINGVIQSYSETSFGILEHSLNYLRTKLIVPS